MNKSAVFACNELDLDEIQVYGFDYDYTLACYKPSLNDLLYNLGRDTLIDRFKVIVKLKKNKCDKCMKKFVFQTVSKRNQGFELYTRICDSRITLRHRKGSSIEARLISANSIGLGVSWLDQSSRQ